MRRRERGAEIVCCDPRTARIARCFDHEVGGVAVDDSLPLRPVSALLLELLDDVESLRPSVLDLGCGTGATLIGLAQAGARRVSGVDLSPASIEVARLRTERVGLEDAEARFEVADAASARLAPHDWVILDRVICCYGDVESLLANAVTTARSRVGFTAPESRGWRGLLNRLGWGADNLWKRVLRRPTCRGFVHDLDAAERLLVEAGFRRLRDGLRGLWYAVVYERVA